VLSRPLADGFAEGKNPKSELYRKEEELAEEDFEDFWCHRGVAKFAQQN
jgi:hypothetical protein